MSTSLTTELAQHQPLLLAVGVACATLTKSSTDRYIFHTACPGRACLRLAAARNHFLLRIVLKLYGFQKMLLPVYGSARVASE